MLDWFIVACGGAALYAAGKLLNVVTSRKKRSQQGQTKKGKYGQPLRLVVAQCEARWFLQELKLAMDADAEAMVRVAHMLMAGYGTQQDHTAAAQWMRQAWAIQNYKEPSQLHDMLDVRDSAIPALNEASRGPAGSTLAKAAASHTCREPAADKSQPNAAGTSLSRMVAPGQGCVDAGTACQMQQGHAAVETHTEHCRSKLPHQQQLQQQGPPALVCQQQQQEQVDLVVSAKRCHQQRQRVVAKVAKLTKSLQHQQMPHITELAVGGAVT